MRALLVAVLAALLLPASAQAGRGMETGIADDAVLLGGGAAAEQAVSEWARLGVDVVRIHVRWVAIAPAPNSVHEPVGFDARNPDDPQYNWAPVDNALRLLGDAHIRAMLAVTGSGPLWASREPARGNPRYLPDAGRFGAFAAAVAKRYGPRVDRYLVWNEPNQPAWLQPQFTCRGTRCTPASPAIYRDLFRAASREIRAADPTAQILIGTMSPTGQSPTRKNAVMRPLQFLRALACVDDKKLKRVRTGACRNQATIRADGVAYHPHPVRFSPATKATNPDNAAIADLPHFEAVLDRATANGILKPTSGKRFPLYLTEFGYQTDPPDPDSGVSPARQAAWLQWSWYLAWRDPRVRNITQYEWRDEPVKTAESNAFASWQSGLHYADGRAKPSLAVFPVPFFVAKDKRRSTATLWGQVRPGGAWTVTLERASGGSNTFAPIGTVRTDATGYFTKKVTLRGSASYRFSYTGDSGATVRSAPARCSPTQSSSTCQTP